MISAQLIRDIFLFCRTKRAVEFSNDAIDPVFDVLPETPLGSAWGGVPNTRGALLDFGAQTIWEDGFAIHFRSMKAPIDLANEMAPALSELDG